MFLAIDAGNSNVVFALYDSKGGKWTNQFRLETKAPQLISQLSKKVPLYFLEHGITADQIDAIGFSSVVPEINEILEQFCEGFKLRATPTYRFVRIAPMKWGRT